MKRKIIFSVLMLALSASIFAKSMNSKKGYFDLAWGSTVEDAKKAGFKLTPASDAEKEQIKSNFTQDIDAYYVSTKDKNVKSLDFFYYMGRLFSVNEFFICDGTQKKLEGRYGNFKENGIVELGGQYADPVVDTNGKIKEMSIIIMPQKDGIVAASLFDWNVYKNISVTGRQASGLESDSIVDQFEELSQKLLQDGKNGKKASYAFVALNSDNGNALTENYVTDALTESIFNTGKVRIIERANLEKILSEQKFQSSGLVNEDSAKEIGQIAGVDYVCYGTLKDLGDEITVNARVVDVETGEICAMARDTIKKDDYLKKNVASSGTTKSTKTNTTKSATSTQKKMNNLWTVRKSRNEFDGYTTYTFILKGPNSNCYCFFGYDKNDVPSKSMVRAGFSWNKFDTSGSYDIKTEDGNMTTKKTGYAYWSYDTGWKNGNEKFYFSYNNGESARFYLNLFESNNYLTVRHRDLVQRFQTAGFWDAVESAGITREEIEEAIANEEF